MFAMGSEPTFIMQTWIRPNWLLDRRLIPIRSRSPREKAICLWGCLHLPEGLEIDPPLSGANCDHVCFQIKEALEAQKEADEILNSEDA